MERDPTSEDNILSKLQSSADLTDINLLFTAHLNPFTPHFKPSTAAASRKKPKSKPPENPPDSLRSLAKKFLPFLHKSLSIIPKRLSESPQIPHHTATELFDAYRLCLKCLTLIAPELAGKPYAVEVQKIRYIHCLEHWELYREAETEGFFVLESFTGIVKGDQKGKPKKSNGRLVPELDEGSIDRELNILILEIVVTLVKCSAKRRSKEDADYRRIIALVNESQSLFKTLDAKDFGKFHQFLVVNLHIIIVFLVSEINNFDVDLICEFCLVTFKECKKSHTPDQMHKVAVKILSSLFSQLDKLSSDIIIGVSKHVLDHLAADCEVVMDASTRGFFELVSYCSNKCRGANVYLCGAIAQNLNRLADGCKEDSPFFSSILRLYVAGLLASSASNQPKEENTKNYRNANEGSGFHIFLDNKELLHQVSASFTLFQDQFNDGIQDKNPHQSRMPYTPYWEALRFFCQSLAEFVYSRRSDIFSAAESTFCWDDFSTIRRGFHQFCSIFLQFLSTKEREKEISGDDQRVICLAVVAALILSFKLNTNKKESVLLVKHLISVEWVPSKRLKYLYTFLYNLAVILYRNKRLKEAIKALNLCCKASWSYTTYLSEMHVDKLNKTQDDFSEKIIADHVKETSDKSAFLLNLLNQEGSSRINNIVVESLRNWSVSENLITTLPIPASFVKEWVKIEIMRSIDNSMEHGMMLYSLLPSSAEMSRRALGKILEEELLAYEENCHLNPRLCHRMRIKVIEVLLEEVYVTKDHNLEKSRLLIEKGRVLRAHGLEFLEECSKCLSSAISILKSICCTNKAFNSRVHHLLIHAYVLHAICTQETVSNSIVLLQGSEFIQDIRSAVELSLNPKHGSDNQYDVKSEDMLYSWYLLIDLLSIKGYVEFFPGIYDVVIKLFNRKNFSLEKAMTELWKNQRLGHALCVSPINHKLMRNFSECWSELCDSNEFWKNCMKELNPLVVGFRHIDKEIKQIASDLISHVPTSSASMFLYSHYCYKFAGRLISTGQMIEAFSYAKEAHRLRGKLLQQKFEYSVEKMTETRDENGAIFEKSYYGIKAFKANDVAMIKGSCDYEGCVLTPWNVLSCYLESILQVGVVHELLGNGSEAEMLLRWGKNVSQFKGLPLFEISFSSVLGKLYRKQKFWCLAEKELTSSKKMLVDHHTVISCEKCVCMLEVSLNQQLGDLFFSRSCSAGEPYSVKGLFDAKSFYQLALNKLNNSEWRNFEFTLDEGRTDKGICKKISSSRHLAGVLETNDSTLGESVSKIESKRSRRTKQLKSATQRLDHVGYQNRRITRSTYRSTGNTGEIVPADRQVDPTVGLATEHASTSASGDHDMPGLDKFSVADFQNGISSLCNKMKCWHCLHLEVVDCGSLNKLIWMEWELVYRKLSLRLLISIGKFSGVCGNAHEAHNVLLQSSAVLFGRNSSCSKYSSLTLVFLIESIGKQFPGDLLAVERAALLYYICWFTLRSYPDQFARKFCCELSCIETRVIVSLLKLAFTLCREVPLLFQKVSRLLAIVYVLATSIKHFSLLPSKEGSESQLSSFFHQASLGPHINRQFFSTIVRKHQSQIASDSEDSLLLNSASTFSDIPDSLRLAPESSEDLEEFIHKFFKDLPSSPVLCISLVSGVDAILLRELLGCSLIIRAWILLSHLTLERQRVILLPVDTTLEASADSSSNTVVFDCKDFVKRWQCPWVSSAIDDIAPVFRHVLEGNYYSSSEYFLEHIKDNKSLWWLQRNQLDECLAKFLQDMEDLWLGNWKYFLLGEWPDLNFLESLLKKLSDEDEHLLRHTINKNCYVSLRSEASSKRVNSFENILQLAFKTMAGTSQNFDLIEYSRRQPMILVLDLELQMLPWENMPILRNQEVYRMPSVGSILVSLDRCGQNQELIGPTIPAIPLIDPLDSYYLLNPDGDLRSTQVEFENWFKDQNIEGMTGSVPTTEELTHALENHDLFIYFGHGSGTQYIPGYEIQKLNNCAASLLLGCSSGSLYLKGSYVPQGAPLSYLIAGSPVVIANLWEVTDKDIDRFGKAMLNAWLRERSAECTECDVPVQTYKSSTCNHRRRIGSFMALAREACNLGYLIGASPVCYGVPTGIIKRKDV